MLEFGPVKSLLYPLLVLIARIAIRNSGQDAYYYATTHRFGAEHAVIALLAGKLAQDVSHELEGIRQPTLVIWGAEALGTLPHTHFNQGVLPDSLGPKQAHIELLPDGGLAIHEELPRKVAETILQWSENNALVASPVSISSNIKNSFSQPLRVEDAGAEQDSSAATDSEKETSSLAEAYCVKCKTKRPMLNAREVTIKNGRFAVRGECAVCGTQLFRMGRLPAGYPQTPV